MERKNWILDLQIYFCMNIKDPISMMRKIFNFNFRKDFTVKQYH